MGCRINLSHFIRQQCAAPVSRKMMIIDVGSVDSVEEQAKGDTPTMIIVGAFVLFAHHGINQRM